MHLLLINQFLPPDESPTARLLGELGETLRSAGHRVTYVGENGGYRARKTLLGSRALRETVSLLRLLASGLPVRKIDAVICLTSPPLIPVVGHLLARWHRAPFVHWAMDIYPDVAVALGDVANGSSLHRWTARSMASAYRHARLVVALDPDMETLLRQHGARHTKICPPWPPVTTISPPDTTPRSHLTWLYSGNLGRAHEWKTLLDAQRRLEDESLPIDLVFQGAGPQRQAAQDYARSLSLQRCHWRAYAADNELVTSHLNADLIVVTQRPETRGHLWPSKLSLAFHLPRPIAFVGDVSSSVAQSVRDHSSDSSAFSPGDDHDIARYMTQLCHSADRASRHNDMAAIERGVQEQGRQGRKKWLDWIEQLS